MKRKVHAAKLREGTLLWPAFQLLCDRGVRGATTMEIDAALNPPGVPKRVAVGASNAVGDLRKVAPSIGWDIPRAKSEGKNNKGRRVFRYYAVRIPGWQAPDNESDHSAGVKPSPAHSTQPVSTVSSGQLFPTHPIR